MVCVDQYHEYVSKTRIALDHESHMTIIVQLLLSQTHAPAVYEASDEINVNRWICVCSILILFWHIIQEFAVYSQTNYRIRGSRYSLAPQSINVSAATI